MTPTEFKALLRRNGIIKVDSDYKCLCTLCQPTEQLPEKFHVLITKGRKRPVIGFCYKCCVAGDSQRNYRWWKAFLADKDIPTQLTGFASKAEIDYLWSEVDNPSDLPPAADISQLDTIYKDLLDHLTLSLEHEKWLSKRKLSPQWANAIGYRSSVEDTSKLQEYFRKTYREHLSFVPGFLADGRILLRYPAILIPCREISGKIVAIKQRLLDEKKGRMRLLSSSSHGGPKAINCCHVPFGVGFSRWDSLWVTEGERKADYNYFIKERPTIAVPGVAAWRQAISVIGRVAKPKATVILALDQDKAGKEATEYLIKDLPSNYRIQVARWTSGKGLDDTDEVEIRDIKRSVKGADPTTRNHSSCLPSNSIVDWIKQHEPILRSRIPCSQYEISKLIKQGLLVIEYSQSGQVIKVKK